MTTQSLPQIPEQELAIPVQPASYISAIRLDVSLKRNVTFELGLGARAMVLFRSS